MTSFEIRRILTGSVALLLLASVVISFNTGGNQDRTLTATFARTTSLYAGASVKVLGVPVGKVDSIKVVGTGVEVKISYDPDVDLPKDVHALIVPPSIVGDRFVQLAPAYTSGGVLPDRAHLGLNSTGIPVELDDTYAALDKVAAGLGPNGANKDGALSRLVTATAQNISGHGAAFNTTVRQLAGALGTLAGSSDDIDGSVSNLAKLTETLAGKDAELRALVANLAKVGAELNGQRDDLGDSVVELGSALKLVSAFLQENRAAIKNSVQRTTDVTAVLARRTDELSELLDLAPVGLTSLTNIYVPKNWDPAKPWLTPVGGRAGSANLRADFTSNLDTQLGSLLGAVCAQLPPAEQVKLSAFCSTLTAAGGDLGALLSTLIEQRQVRSTPGATSLSVLMGGRR